MEIKSLGAFVKSRPKKFWAGSIFIVVFAGSFAYLSLRQSTYDTASFEIAGRPLALEVADNDWKRGQGLAGRDSLAPDGGMIFIFDEPTRHGFWMKGMRFPLDFIWLYGDTIVDLTPDVPVAADGDQSPPSYYPRAPVTAMIEVNAGFIRETGLKIGNHVNQLPGIGI